MMVMGYLLAPNKRKTKKSKGAAPHEDAGLREALLEQPEGEGGVPKGYFAVYVGEDARRFVVPTGYLREPAFLGLMERTADEFGFAQAAGLRLHCAEEDFQELLRGIGAKGRKKTIS